MSTENASAVERQRQTTAQVEQLGLAVGGLHDTISILQDKLSNISQNQPKNEPSNEKVKERESLCDLASEVRNNGDSVYRAKLRLNEIIDRLEN